MMRRRGSEPLPSLVAIRLPRPSRSNATTSGSHAAWITSRAGASWPDGAGVSLSCCKWSLRFSGIETSFAGSRHSAAITYLALALARALPPQRVVDPSAQERPLVLADRLAQVGQ